MITQYLRDLTMMLSSPKLKSSKLYHFTSTDPKFKVNSALLAGSYLLIIEKRSPEEINSLFTSQTEFISYCDASSPKSDFELTFLDCLKGLQRAVLLGWYDYLTFDIHNYVHYSSVETGGFNWIVPNKIIAFICPAQDSSGRDGVKPLTPEQFSPIFRSLGVTTIIRLNKKNYEKERFTRNGFEYHDLYFIDGSVPAGQIIKDFLRICENEQKVVAVHCKAGLGRTGTLIGCFVIKHFAFSASEFIAWARFSRPGSVLGPQQQFLVDIERICWRWGEKFRRGEGEDDLEVKEIEEIRNDGQIKARFGDYRQAERLYSASVANGTKSNPGTINKWKIAKKQVFNKNK
jgi:cell division cycle 14